MPEDRSHLKNNIPTTGSLNSVKRPFEYLHCDTIGSLFVDSYGNKYVLHFVDTFSKFSILVPVTDITALTVVNSILTDVYSVFGAPRSIHSDNESGFSTKYSLFCANTLILSTSCPSLIFTNQMF
ncbi:hypothetical protein P9112_011829 [Eukaryota sp. TZLM1-RC]